jgi:hypothetical protein
MQLQGWQTCVPPHHTNDASERTDRIRTILSYCHQTPQPVPIRQSPGCGVQDLMLIAR